MIKKIVIVFFMVCFYFIPQTFAECQFNEDPNASVSDMIQDCYTASGVPLVTGNGSLQGTGLKGILNSWISTIGSILFLFAVGGIVYGSLQLVISTGDDEKIKKGKDIVKWSIVGMIGVVTAGLLISMIVNIMYGISAP